MGTQKAEKPRYAKRLKEQVPLRPGVDGIEYFKALAKETGIPCQNLVTYIGDTIEWRSVKGFPGIS